MAQKENPYDAVQYLSHPYYQTHPEHLCTLGRLFGLEAAPFSQAKVLELGCASGGNIIPMAMNAPEAKFIGIDFAQKQIEMGQKQIKALKLKNIQLETKSIEDFKPVSDKFDYIICHGIYSWVGSNVRDKILAVCRENLAPNGIAYISYNTLPGWNMVKSVRDMMLFHTQNFDTPQKKASEARGLLNFIADGMKGEQTPYALLLKNEVELLSKQPDSYLLHDHLEEVNYPLYFHQFVKHANQHELTYLSDTPLFTMYPSNLPKKIAQELNKITDIVRVGQYMDFVRNQRFRCTLLCQKEANVKRNLNTDDISQFYLTYGGALIKDLPEDQLKDGVSVDFVGSGITLTVRNRVSKLAMLILNEALGLPMSYSALIEKVMQRAKETNSEKVQKTLNGDLNLMRLALGGLIGIHSSVPNYVATVPEKPKVMPFVRQQAQEGQMVTNQKHQVVGLNLVEKVLVQYLDGKHTKYDLVEKICDHVEKGDFTMKNDKDEVITSPKEIAQRANNFCEQILNRFAQNALLVKNG